MFISQNQHEFPDNFDHNQEYKSSEAEQIDTNPSQHNHPIGFKLYKEFTDRTITFAEAYTLSRVLESVVSPKKELKIIDLIQAFSGKHKIVTANNNPYNPPEIKKHDEKEKIKHWSEIALRLASNNTAEKKKIKAQEKDLLNEVTLQDYSGSDLNKSRAQVNRFINKLLWHQQSPFLT